jgi:hypothetical protein
MSDKMTWRQQQAAVATVKEKLKALAEEYCEGSLGGTRATCRPHSLQAQAMAKALLTLIADEERWPGQNGDHTEMLIKLGAELERAETI